MGLASAAASSKVIGTTTTTGLFLLLFLTPLKRLNLVFPMLINNFVINTKIICYFQNVFYEQAAISEDSIEEILSQAAQRKSAVLNSQ